MSPARRTIRDRIAAAVFAALVILTAVSVTWLLRQGYAVYRLRRGVGDTWFLAADGHRWFRLDEHRQDVALSEIPEHLQNAFVAIEDHRFYSHPGVDPIALARAAFRNVREPGTVEGGSTLTQQLARTLFLSNKRSYGRKVREAASILDIDVKYYPCPAGGPTWRPKVPPVSLTTLPLLLRPLTRRQQPGIAHSVKQLHIQLSGKACSCFHACSCL